jgi:hypothetical protein
VTREEHVAALHTILLARVGAVEPPAARSLLRSRLRWVERELATELLTGSEQALAQRFGILSLVESCRDEHLAALDADDGLLTLGIAWEEVVAGVGRAPRPPTPKRCPRCADAMIERPVRRSRKRRRSGKRARTEGLLDHRVYSCTACGHMLRS